MKFSFIVPVYNVAPYLRECLDSLLAQNISAGDYEIIAVNDGSTDGSLAILREYEAMYPGRFAIIDQLNAGPGVARNTGFAASHGDFIWFVDGDDIVRHSSLQTIVKTFETTNAEVLRMGYESFEGSPPADAFVAADTLIPMPTFPARELVFSNWTPWDKVFSRKLLLRAGLKFPPLLLGDDAAELFRVMAQAQKIVKTDTVCYFYRQRPGSLMRVFNERGVADDVRSCEIVRDQIQLFPELRDEYEYFFWRLLSCMVSRYESAVSLQNCDVGSKAVLDAHLPAIKAMFDAAGKPDNPYISLSNRLINEQRAYFKGRIELIKNSLSWKITAPVRFLPEMALRIKKRFKK